MFFDIGPLELVAIVVLAVLVFGPDKLPKLIQDVMGFIRKVREFSDSAKEDIRRELGPEFKDFEFEDLNPKTFIRKNLMSDEDEYGLKELKEIGSTFDLRKDVAGITDLRKDMAEVTDAVNGVEPATAGASSPSATTSANGSSGAGSATPDRLRKRDPIAPDEAPPFDTDAT